MVQKKLYKVLRIVILQPFAAESDGFHQNAQKLTANTKNEPILNIAINYFKSINTGDIFKAVSKEEKFAISERYKINGNHFHPKN